MDLQKFKEALAQEAYGMTSAEAYSKGICISCREPAGPKTHSEAGRREYKITAMCEECFDKQFAEEG